MILSKRFASDNLMTEFINEACLTKEDIVSIIFDEKYRSYVMIYEVPDEVTSDGGIEETSKGKDAK